MRSVVAIGGSDSSGCAGIQADLRAIQALGFHAASVVTAITAQRATEVLAQQVVDPQLLAAQMRAVPEVHAAKTGMLCNRATVETVAELLPIHVPLVVDPVLAATGGDPLVSKDGIEAMAQVLFPRATLVTPNAPEAERLTGLPVRNPCEAQLAGAVLVERGCAAVLIKGGHFEAHPGVDVLVTRQGASQLRPHSVQGPHRRATGCTLASAIAAYLGADAPLKEAIERARVFVARSINSGYGVGADAGPVDASFCIRGQRSMLGLPRLGRLHVITDESLQGRFQHNQLAKLALQGGACAIQYREKRAINTGQRIDVATQMSQMCHDAGAMLVVNDRADIARAVGAEGVHVGAQDLNAGQVRGIVGPSVFVGVTANSRAQALAALALPIDYLGVGPVFGTHSKQDSAPAMGVEVLGQIVRDAAAANIAVIGIGNIGVDSVAQLMDIGVYGIAVLSGVCCAPDPAAATKAYAEAIQVAIRGQ